ncbi:MBL fold metallo-hydrolase, partial [Streptomyces palmae]
MPLPSGHEPGSAVPASDSAPASGPSRGRGPAARRPLSRRLLLGASATGLVTALTAGAVNQSANGAQLRGTRGSSGVRLRWLGNNGWEIRIDRPGKQPATVLIDPWLTRFHTGTYTPAGADPKTELTVDTDLIDRHRLVADQILVTHGHYDHLPDVPHLARTTGATVLGTETHANLLRALGAPEGQLSVVSGGEYLRCDGYTIRVLRSLHSMPGPRAQVPFPGT